MKVTQSSHIAVSARRIMDVARPLFAGVIPFSIDASGTARLLLSQERFGRETSMWSGFAGRVEVRDANVIAAAAREGHEESCGLLGSARLLESLLETTAMKLEVPRGVHYLLPFQYISYLPRMFQGVQGACIAARQNGLEYSPFLEKSDIRWCTLDEIASMPLRIGFRTDLAAIDAAVRQFRPTCFSGLSSGALGLDMS